MRNLGLGIIGGALALAPIAALAPTATAAAPAGPSTRERNSNMEIMRSTGMKFETQTVLEK